MPNANGARANAPGWRLCWFCVLKNEHRALNDITVWFACFPPDEPHTCHLFLKRSPSALETATVNGKVVVAVALRATKAVDVRRDFMAAVMGAISLR